MGAEELSLHDRYSRDDVAQAYGEDHGRGGKWMSGVVPIGDDELALFVTLDKSSYSGQHRYEDAFESRDVLRWKSQTRASPDNAWGEKHIEGGPEQRPHHLFVRTKKGEDFVYCGQVRYADHEGSKPMTIWWELEHDLPEDLYTEFEEATDHAGGREAPAYIKSKKMDVQPAAEGLRAVPSGDEYRLDHLEESPYEWENTPWGWASTVQDFLDADAATILESLEDHHERRFENLPLGENQRSAWEATIERFKEWLSPLVDHQLGKDTLIALEYELPGEGGRRPDVVLVTPSHDIFVIECKNKPVASVADLDEALRYKQDLEEYHSESHGQKVTAILALLKEAVSVTDTSEEYPVQILSPSEGVEPFQDALRKSLDNGETYAPEQWLLGDYAPLPHLMEAVISTFDDRPLPRLKTVRSSNVPDAVETIQNLASEAQENEEHILVLVTGVPGSGKTLVGIESSIKAQKNGIDSLFLSGNGPLVAVLQDALDRAGAQGAAKGLVRPMYKFKQGVTANERSTPADFYVFDEGQRAWSAEKNNNWSCLNVQIQA